MGSEHIEIQTLLNELARRIEIGHALPLFINSYVITMNVISLAGNVSMTGTELSSALYSLKSMGGGKSINFNWQRWKKSGQVRCCTKHTAVCSQMLIAYIYKSNDAFTVKNSTALPDTLSQDRSSTSPYHFRQVMQSWKSSNPYPATVNGARNPKTRVSDGNPLQVSRCWSDVHIHSFKAPPILCEQDDDEEEEEEEDSGENIGVEGDEDLLLSCTRRRYRLPPALLRFLSCIDRQMAMPRYPSLVSV